MKIKFPKFQEWLTNIKEDVHPDFYDPAKNPLKNMKLGGNPLISGVNKLSKGLKEGKVTSGYTGGFSVIADVFGLSDEEIQQMIRSKIVKREQDGWYIDTNILTGYHRQFMQTPTFK